MSLPVFICAQWNDNLILRFLKNLKLSGDFKTMAWKSHGNLSHLCSKHTYTYIYIYIYSYARL